MKIYIVEINSYSAVKEFVINGDTRIIDLSIKKVPKGAVLKGIKLVDKSIMCLEFVIMETFLDYVCDSVEHIEIHDAV